MIGGDRIIGHSGGHYGVAGEVMVWPASGYRFSVLSNSEPDGYFEIVSFIKKAISGADAISRNFDFNRDLSATFLGEGIEAAQRV